MPSSRHEEIRDAQAHFKKLIQDFKLKLIDYSKHIDRLSAEVDAIDHALNKMDSTANAGVNLHNDDFIGQQPGIPQQAKILSENLADKNLVQQSLHLYDASPGAPNFSAISAGTAASDEPATAHVSFNNSVQNKLVDLGPVKSARLNRPKLSVNWVIGPPDNIAWAYGNNAKRLMRELSGFDHSISSNDPCDIAVYFDVIVAERFPVSAKHSIVRIGGPRPLDRLYGDDRNKLRDGLARFDAVIALSHDLFQRVNDVHPNSWFIPNALDLDEWCSVTTGSRSSKSFVVGFAASMKSSAEIDVKGFDYARQGADLAGAEFVYVEKKDGNQIAHEEMRDKFYSRIDVLAHPVAAGREGTSNVIMEALAAGVAVVTTPDAGLHGETLVDRKTALIRERDVDAYAEAFILLKSDKKLRARIAAAGRKYAERNHDIKSVAKVYGRIIAQAGGLLGRSTAMPSVCFVPFWRPIDKFASSRLRAFYPAKHLQEAGYDNVSTDYNPAADIAVIIQSCDNSTFDAISSNRDQFIIYDVCDRYFEHAKIFKMEGGDVDSLSRYHELIARADLVTVSTIELKAEIASRNPGKPVIYVPDGIDYEPDEMDVTSPDLNTVLWFGNPDRGNFDSSVWLIERLQEKYNFKPLIVSRKGFFKKYPHLQQFVVEWTPENIKKAFSKASLCVLSHAPEESTKSPNRFVTAIMHGVPTIVSGSPVCASILESENLHFANIKSEKHLDVAISKLSDLRKRRLFVSKLQRLFRSTIGKTKVADSYIEIFKNKTYRKSIDRAVRVAFVTHNLSVSEGAPWSLFELAKGLASDHNVQCFAYSAGAGPLASAYERAGVPIHIFDPSINHCSKALAKRYGDSLADFQQFLADNEIDVVVCNTVRAAPYAYFAESKNIPSILIIRESFGRGKRFDGLSAEAKLAAEAGTVTATKVVFVAETSRRAWDDQRFNGAVHVIPNGISASRFNEAINFSKNDIRSELGLRANDIVAVCVGTINARKGQQEIIAAFAKLPEAVVENSTIVFVGATDGDYIKLFQAEVDKLPENIRRKIRLVRSNDDVGPWYAASDIFLMNSSSEAYPRSVMEALYFGLPVLSTKVFGVLEQVSPGKNGFLYDFNDMDSWSKHFTALVNNHELRLILSEDAKRSFWKLTTHAEMLHCYKALIMESAQLGSECRSIIDS